MCMKNWYVQVGLQDDRGPVQTLKWNPEFTCPSLVTVCFPTTQLLQVPHHGMLHDQNVTWGVSNRCRGQSTR